MSLPGFTAERTLTMTDAEIHSATHRVPTDQQGLVSLAAKPCGPICARYCDVGDAECFAKCMELCRIIQAPYAPQ